MAGMKVSELDFLQLLPAFMRDDEAVIALSKAMDKLLGEPAKRLSTIRTWDKIDELNDAECDELAWELDIDWYNSTDMSLEEKRATIKAAQQIKRKRGTKSSVERLISAHFGDGYVLEWFETGGTPYTFSVLTTNAHILPENFTKFVEAANAAKNVRSHVEGIFYFWQQDTAVECALETSLHRYDFGKCGTYPRPATLGFVVKHGVETEAEVAPHLYGFSKTGEHKCGENGAKATLGAAVVGTAIVGKTILRD